MNAVGVGLDVAIGYSGKEIEPFEPHHVVGSVWECAAVVEVGGSAPLEADAFKNLPADTKWTASIAAVNRPYHGICLLPGRGVREWPPGILVPYPKIIEANSLNAHMNRRLARGPGARLLELRREPNQRCLVTETSSDLHANRESRRGRI